MTSSGFVFAAPTEALPVPVEPTGQVSTGLEVISKDPVQRGGLVCNATFGPEMRSRAIQEAKQLLPSMLNDANVFINYGVDQLSALNRLVDRILKDVEPTKIPEAQGAMKDLKVKMLAAKGKYDISDEKVKKNYQEAVSKPKRFWRKTTNFLEMLRADFTDLEKQINQLEKDLSGRAIQLTRNAEFCVQLYQQNDIEIANLVYTIGVMELILEEAKAEARNIPAGSAGDISDPNSEKRGKYADLIRQMEVKIGEYKSRLFVAWASAPQLRMMRAMDVDMAMKLHMLVQSALPTTKLVLVQWRMLLQADENAKIGEAAQDYTENMITGYFDTAATQMPKIAQSIQRQTISPETVSSVVSSLVEMVDGIGQAYTERQQQRQVMDETLMQAQRELSTVKGRVDDSVINGIVGQAVRPLALTK